MLEFLRDYMDPASADAAELAASLLGPIFVLFVTAMTAWLLQAALTYRIYMKTLYPELRQNNLLRTIVAWPAIASHEVIGHFAVGAISGAHIKEVRITSRQGHVVSRVETSVGGMASVFFSSFGPSFNPPLVLAALFMLMFPGELLYDARTIEDAFTSNIIANAVVIPNTLTDLFNPMALVYTYLLVVMASTAGSSIQDLKSLLEAFLKKPPTVIALIAIACVILAAADQFALRIIEPVLWIVVLCFILVLYGLAIDVLLAVIIRFTHGFWMIEGAVVAVFFAVAYYLARVYGGTLEPILSEPLPGFAAAVLATILLTALMKKRRYRVARRVLHSC